MRTHKSIFCRAFIFSVIFSFCHSVSVNAQELKPFSISGDVTNVKDRIIKVKLDYEVAPRERITDSCDVINGKYFFKGKIRDGRWAVLMTTPDNKNREEIRFVYIEPAEMKAISASNFSDLTLTGSKGQPDYVKWQQAQRPFLDSLKLLYKLSREAEKKYESGKKEADSIAAEKYKELAKLVVNKKMMDFNLEYAKEHIESPIIMEIIKMLYLPEYESEQERLFYLAPVALQKTQLGETLSMAYPIKPGKQGPDFTLPDTSGNKVTLSSFRGKYVLLDFWASWCILCRKESPYLIKAFSKYKENFTILSVSLDKVGAKQAWLEAIRKDKVGLWTHVSSLTGFNSEAGKLYGYVTSLPTNFLLDKDGKIVAKNLRGEELEKKLQELLGQSLSIK